MNYHDTINFGGSVGVKNLKGQLLRCLIKKLGDSIGWKLYQPGSFDMKFVEGSMLMKDEGLPRWMANLTMVGALNY